VKNKGLTPKQQRFVEEYLIDLNATQAAIRAGYSKKTANVQGSQNLTKLSIQTFIRDAQKERSERLEISQDRFINELYTLAFMDIGDVCTWGPDYLKIKPLSELTPEHRAVIREIKILTTKNGKIRGIKMHDKLKRYCRHILVSTRSKLSGLS